MFKKSFSNNSINDEKMAEQYDESFKKSSNIMDTDELLKQASQRLNVILMMRKRDKKKEEEKQRKKEKDFKITQRIWAKEELNKERIRQKQKSFNSVFNSYD